MNMCTKQHVSLCGQGSPQEKDVEESGHSVFGLPRL